MSDKKRRSVTLDPENYEYLQQLDNGSAVINRVVSQLRKGGDEQTAAIDLQIRQKKRELSNAEDEVARIETELTELTQLRDELQNRDSVELVQAREALEGTPKEETNPAVQHWADKLGMTEQELLDAL